MMYHPGIGVVWVGLSLLIMEWLEEAHGFIPVEELPEREGGYEQKEVGEKLFQKLTRAAIRWREKNK